MEVGILEQKQWIITGILVVIAVVIALSFNSLTGKATSKLTNTILPLNSEITLTPTSVKAGEEIVATTTRIGYHSTTYITMWIIHHHSSKEE